MIEGPAVWKAALNDPNQKRPLFYVYLSQYGVYITSFIPSLVNTPGGSGPWAIPISAGEGFGLVPFGGGGGFGT
jgi:hypothetical protein